MPIERSLPPAHVAGLSRKNSSRVFYIPKDEFESIEEWHSNQSRNYLVGIIHFSKLQNTRWWKENEVSLILYPEAIIESLEISKVKKRSLELGMSV